MIMGTPELSKVGVSQKIAIGCHGGPENPYGRFPEGPCTQLL